MAKRNHQDDSPLSLWPDGCSGGLQTKNMDMASNVPLLRLGVIKQPKTQTGIGWQPGQ